MDWWKSHVEDARYYYTLANKADNGFQDVQLELTDTAIRWGATVGEVEEAATWLEVADLVLLKREEGFSEMNAIDSFSPREWEEMSR